ncbi:MAG TPA: radical SAM protein, partial [Actinomycetota bacterium]|nr:radical SAM protein [Actinomycetota bacterium]
MPWEGSKIPATFDLAPLLVFWEVTRACGLSCRHCRAAAIEQALPGELSTEEGMDLIRGLSEFGPRQPVLILTGGDALMRKDVLALASLATSQGMPLALAPSVTPLLTEEVVHRAKALGVRAMSVSLDGATPTTHDGIRGVPGHHERTLAAIEMLVRSGLTVQINTAVMRRNVEELAAIAELVGTLGAQIWEVFFLI